MYGFEKSSTYFYQVRRLKKMRNLCVLIVVVLAVLVGILYYWNDVKGQDIEQGGSLVYLEEWMLWE